MDKRDIRIIKTKDALYDAIFYLLSKNSFDNITVNDICQEALVSRSTFYLHFKDKYDLALYSLDRARKKLDYLQTDDIKERLVLALRKIKENETAFYNLFIGPMNEELNKMTQDYFSDFFNKHISKLIKDRNISRLTSVFYSTGLARTVSWWIENKYPVSVEELAEFQYSMMNKVNL